MISVAYPLPHLRIIIVSFVESNNGRRRNLHPDGCGNSLVLERDDHGVGMQLWLRIMAPGKLACYYIDSDGSDGCCVAFAAKLRGGREMLAIERGSCLDGRSFFT